MYHRTQPSTLVPPSPVFTDFLARFLDGAEFVDEPWPDQIAEDLNSNAEARRALNPRLARLITDQAAQDVIERAYYWFHKLMSADGAALDEFHRRFRFIAVVGIPRTGGSYLTAELYSALGLAPNRVPAAIAHDGFPDACPPEFASGRNYSTLSLSSMAEYMAIVELYFGAATVEGQKIVVPKKLTKAVYAGGLFKTILGGDAEYIVTVRNPVDCCISTYEKSGGLPADGQFMARSAIEKWVRRDVGHIHASGADRSYFESYLCYWEQYHIRLALSGLLSNRKYSVLPFGKDGMERFAASFHQRFNSAAEPQNFMDMKNYGGRHSEWRGLANEVIARVASVWQAIGLGFPAEELMN